MNRYSTRLAKLGFCTLIFSSMACQNGELQQNGSVPGSVNNRSTMNKTQAMPASVSMDQQIKDAVMDLSARTGVAVDAITIRDARAVQWGSGALGCPKPGMNYTQALVPGIRLLLEADGTIHYYHGGTGKSLFYCPAERAQAPTYGQGTEIM